MKRITSKCRRTEWWIIDFIISTIRADGWLVLSNWYKSCASVQNPFDMNRLQKLQKILYISISSTACTLSYLSLHLTVLTYDLSRLLYDSRCRLKSSLSPCFSVLQDRNRPFDAFSLHSLENSLMDMIRTDHDKGKPHPAGGPPMTIADIIWRNHFAG